MNEVLQYIEEVLNSDEKYVPLTLSRKTGMSDYHGKFHSMECENFVFGEETIEGLLNLNFSCQRCGNCCIQKERCENLRGEKGKLSCKIYYSEKYPVSCLTYPFMIDESASEGYGYRVISSFKPLIHYEFGLIDNILTLDVFPFECHWIGERPLRELYYETLKKLIHLKESDVLYPPLKSLIGAIRSPLDKGEITEKDRIDMIRFHKLLISKKELLTEKLLKYKRKFF